MGRIDTVFRGDMASVIQSCREAVVALAELDRWQRLVGVLEIMMNIKSGI